MLNFLRYFPIQVCLYETRKKIFAKLSLQYFLANFDIFAVSLKINFIFLIKTVKT